MSNQPLSTALMEVFHKARNDYDKNSSPRLKIIDNYLVFAIMTAIIQISYQMLVGSFPFNSFLSGLACCIGVFVFGVGMRLQVSKSSQITPQTAFLDFVWCNLILFFAVVNFLG